MGQENLAKTRMTPRQMAVVAELLRSGRTPVVKPRTFREVCAIDTAALVARVRGIADSEWALEDAAKANDFECFRQTRHIIARFSEGRGPESYYATDFWTRWRETLEPVMRAVAAHYDLRAPDFSKVMLARLRAGGAIDPHIDVGVSNHLTHKIHVPLITNDAVWFTVDGERFQLAAGRAYELNNVVPHAVRNDGAEDRVHLIFEMFDKKESPSPPL